MLPNKMLDAERCRFIGEGLREVGYRPADPAHATAATWRVAPVPLTLSRGDVNWLYALGRHLHAFNRALDDLYLDSAAGRQPQWVAGYLDQGKPESLVRYARMRQERRSWPTVIRPDVIPTPEGMWITELDAVPGGLGIIARLAELYKALGFRLIGDDVTLPGAFAAMVIAVCGDSSPRLAIVVSDESAAYRGEMSWLAGRLADYGVEARAVTPQDLHFSDEGVKVKSPFGDFDANAVYRFFELFDLSNIPNADELMGLNARNRVCVVPPFRPFFEEKLAMSLFHHPVLAAYWQSALGVDGYEFLKVCFPPTWVLDPNPLQPNAPLSDLIAGGSDVNPWERLENLGQRQRRFVVKPSGFSERAWGSRGVVVGHDISTPEWKAALQAALVTFNQSPHVLQEFRAGRHFEGSFYDPTEGTVRTIPCRVRLSPYYLVVGEDIHLVGALATMCPLDKKKIHGMPDAIMVPCAVDELRGGER